MPWEYAAEVESTCCGTPEDNAPFTVDTASECQSGYVCYESHNFANAARTGHVPPVRHLIGEPARSVQLCRELVLRVKRDVQSFRSSRSQLNGSHT
jgi:hypothetical protein